MMDRRGHAAGAVLLQKQDDDSYRPIAYGSRSLTDVEQKYGYIEKEAPAIVYGCEHFPIYLYGRRFKLEPIIDRFNISTMKNPKENPPQPHSKYGQFDYRSTTSNVVYRPGTFNLADPLLRLPKEAKPGNSRSNMEACADRYVHYMITVQTPRAM